MGDQVEESKPKLYLCRREYSTSPLSLGTEAAHRVPLGDPDLQQDTEAAGGGPETRLHPRSEVYPGGRAAM